MSDHEPARFVVGTGRCGSTLLSRMLDEHPAIVSLYEVFTGLDWGRRFVDGEVSGEFVADLLATPQAVIDTVVGRGHDVEEVTYPFDRPGARYRRGDPMPWLAVSTLGRLTEDVDALLDDTLDWLRERPDGPIAAHYRALFARLAQDAGGTVWVERSGSSVDYVADLVRLFPDARFVHLHRDGAEVALSMQQHAPYRLAVQIWAGLLPDGVDPADEDAVVEGWLATTPPAELFGRYWSSQIEAGVPVLQQLGDRVLHVNFEAMCAAPANTMGAITDHLGVPADPTFPARAAALVRGVPPARAPRLDPAQRAALDAACATGRTLLAEVLLD